MTKENSALEPQFHDHRWIYPYKDGTWLADGDTVRFHCEEFDCKATVEMKMPELAALAATTEPSAPVEALNTWVEPTIEGVITEVERRTTPDDYADVADADRESWNGGVRQAGENILYLLRQYQQHVSGAPVEQRCDVGKHEITRRDCKPYASTTKDGSFWCRTHGGKLQPPATKAVEGK